MKHLRHMAMAVTCAWMGAASAPRPAPAPAPAPRPAPSPDLDTVRITGRLIDDTGAPIAGGRLFVVPPKVALIALGAHLDVLGGSDLSSLAQGVSGADGVFEIPAGAYGVGPTSEWTRRGPPRMGTVTCTLIVQVDGFEKHAQLIDVPVAGDLLLSDVELHAERRVAVIVIDSQERPLSTARITILDPPANRTVTRDLHILWGTLHVARSDRQGRCELRGLGTGVYQVEVSVPGYVSYRTRIKRGARGTTTDLGEIVLSEGGSLHGRVVDEQDRPLPDVTVEIHRPEGWTSEREGKVPSRPAASGEAITLPVRTDRSGDFHLHSLPSGRFDVLASQWGRRREVRRAVKPGDEPVILRLQRQATLVLTLVDALDGSPVLDAQVVVKRSVKPADRSGHRMIRVEVRAGPAAGPRLGFPDLEPGTWVAGPASPGYQEASVSARGYVRVTHVLPGVPVGQRRNVTLEIAPEAILTGRVTAEDGSPIEGARIACRGPGASSGRDAETDEDGRYRQAGLAAGAWHVKVDARGWSQPEPTLLLPPGETTYDVVLRRVNEVRGRVKPISNTRADVTVAFHAGQLTQLVKTDFQGNYRLGDLPPGEMTIVARTQHGASKPRRIGLAAEEVAHMALSFGTAALHGVVTDGATGERLPHVPVGLRRLDVPSALAEPATPMWRTTDKAGFYEFPGLHAGLYELVLAQRDGREESAHCAWLIDPDGGPAIQGVSENAFDMVTLDARRWRR